MYYILFTTTTCIKCPAFKKFVSEKVDFSGQILDEKSEKFMEYASRFGVMAAPTFIVFTNESLESEIFRASEEYELDEFLKQKNG